MVVLRCRTQQLLLLGTLGLYVAAAVASAAADDSTRALLEAERAGHAAAVREREVDAAATRMEAEVAAAAAAAAKASKSNAQERKLYPMEAPYYLPEAAGRILGLEGASRGRLEVPDWTYGIEDPPEAEQQRQQHGEQEQQEQHEQHEQQQQTLHEAVRIDFSRPFPPAGPWAPVYFSGRGQQYPMGPLLLACARRPSGRATCYVVPQTPYVPVSPLNPKL